jgi:tetratricopeptide (TPR) repeat protein
MTNFARFTNKKVMIIDDLEGMRAQLKVSLSNSGFEKLHILSSIKEGIDRLKTEKYDLILCDYFLGDGTDGQQFLEYLRTRDLISRNTIFVIITAEQALEKVMSASDCAPDDYLLKPFTTSQLHARLEKLLERQEKLAPIDRATDAKDWARVVAECDKLIAVKDKYFVEGCKIKGAALIHGNRPKEAAELYRQLLALRSIGWAKLGLARALDMMGEQDEALRIGRELLAESPRFMAVYDFLAKLLVAAGDKLGALQILQQARDLTPGTMSRIRNISSLAVSTGQPEVAQEVMQQALEKHKYSPVRDVSDYALLSKALTDQDKTEEALSVVRNARGSFVDEKSKAVLAASECVAHQRAGNEKLAEAALAEAMAADMEQLPAEVAAAVADACFAMGREQEANALLKQAIQNNPDDPAVRERVQGVLEAAGKGAEESRAMIEGSAHEVIQLNNDGVRKAEAGELEDAIALLSNAAERLPNNLQIVGNAALVMALDLNRNGIKDERLQACLRYRDMLHGKAPAHPKLTQIDGLLNQVRG